MWNEFKKYQVDMINIKDCDPAYPGLEYIANRFELNIEQRFWLAFLYSTCYCMPNVYYIYNEFPDYENVNIERLKKWWNKNKKKCYFQTDRTKVKNFNKFIPMFISYKKLIGKNQQNTFKKLIIKNNPIKSYKLLYNFCNQVYYVGRFSLFNWLEAMQYLTKIPIAINTLPLEQAKSSRNGLCFVANKTNLIYNKNQQPTITKNDYIYLYKKLNKLVSELKIENPKLNISYWSVETSLCSFKKMFSPWNTRYLGYYIDRLMIEILQMEKNVPNGVNWQVLWDFRKEYFLHKWLGELNNWNTIRTNLMGKYKLNQIL